MNHKRKLFVTEYLKCSNATEAAIAAGYSAKTAKSQGQRLLTFVDISQAIQDAQDKISKEAEVSVAQIVKDIRLLSRSTKSEVVKLKAYDMLMRHLGGYANELALVSKMSDEDVEKLALKIIDKTI
jgi:phage terminase small subunit